MGIHIWAFLAVLALGVILGVMIAFRAYRRSILCEEDPAFHLVISGILGGFLSIPIGILVALLICAAGT